jgi:hypothetical protein
METLHNLPNMTPPQGPNEQHPWSADIQRLRKWFVAYLILLGSGLFVLARSTDSPELRDSHPLVHWLLILCVVAYIGCIVYAYRVQKELNTAGLYRPGAWQVIVGAFLLNPFFLGFLIPASVLWANRRIARRLGLTLPPDERRAPQN